MNEEKEDIKCTNEVIPLIIKCKISREQQVCTKNGFRK